MIALLLAVMSVLNFLAACWNFSVGEPANIVIGSFNAVVFLVTLATAASEFVRER